MQVTDTSRERPPGLKEKVRFLRSPASHADARDAIDAIETHMSWVFFVGDRVLKLKKPVRYPFLDFSTLAARELDCREEVRLNSRLAPGIYLGLVALQSIDGALSLSSEHDRPSRGTAVDWLVLMRRLPAERTLQRLIADAAVESDEIDALVAVLGAFYRRVPAVDVDPPEYLARLQHVLAANREILSRPQLRLPDAGAALDRAEAALEHHAGLLRERAASRRIVDGHGDLRPEHVWLLRPPVVIDCLEFNAELRQVDPFDELAFLALECDIAGASWIGPRVIAGCATALGDSPSPALIDLYIALRALLRARLAMAHLLDSRPRTPKAWPPLAERYIARATRALDRIDDPAAQARAATVPGSR